jgi:hypothetical protein
MQEHSSSTSQVLLDVLKVLAVPFLAASGYFAAWIQNRKKLKPELKILDANAAKTEAEARKLDGETVDRAYDRIDELVMVNYQLRQDCLALQRKVDMSEIRDRFNDGQRRKMKALLDIHGIKYSEFDEPKSLTDGEADSDVMQ